MGTVRRQSLFGLIGLQAGQMIGFVNKAVLYPIVFFGLKDFWGLMEIYYGYAVIAVTIAQFGKARLLSRYLPREDLEPTVFMGFVFKRLILPAVISMAALLIFRSQISGLAEDSDLFAEYYGLFILIFISVFLFNLGAAVAMGRFKAHVPILVNNVALRLCNMTLLLLQIFFEWPIDVFLILLSSMYLLNYGVLYLYIMRNEKVNFRTETIPAGKKKEYGAFSRIIGLTEISNTSQNQLVLLILGYFLGLPQVAIFMFARNIFSVVEMPGKAVLGASNSTIAKSMGKADWKMVGDVYVKSSLSQFLVGSLILSLILTNIDFFLTFMKDDSFRIATVLVMIMGGGKLVDLITGSNANIIANSDYYRFNLYFGVSAMVVQIVLGVYLISEYYLVGAAITFAVSSVLINVARSVFVYRKLKLLPVGRKHRELIVYSILVLGLSLLPHGANWIYTGIIDVLIAIITFVYLRFYPPLTELTELLRKIPVPGRK